MKEEMMKLGSAHHVLLSAKRAFWQTSELFRKRTIISVDMDEAIVIERAVKEYIERCENELKQRGEY